MSDFVVVGRSIQGFAQWQGFRTKWLATNSPHYGYDMRGRQQW